MIVGEAKTRQSDLAQLAENIRKEVQIPLGLARTYMYMYIHRVYMLDHFKQSYAVNACMYMCM